MKALEIFEGWKNYYLSQVGLCDPEVEKEAKRRIDICSSCDWLVKGSEVSPDNQSIATISFPDDYFCNPDKSEEINGVKVQGCGCMIKMKGYSSSHCPRNKFDK